MSCMHKEREMTNRKIDYLLGIGRLELEVRRPLLILRLRHAKWPWRRSRQGAGTTGLVGIKEGGVRTKERTDKVASKDHGSN